MSLRPAQRWLSKENNKLQTNQDYIVKPYQEEGGEGKGEDNKERKRKARKDKREEKEVRENRKRQGRKKI